MTNYSKKIAEIFPVKAKQNIIFMNRGHQFTLEMPCSCQREGATQRPKRLNVNGNSTTL